MVLLILFLKSFLVPLIFVFSLMIIYQVITVIGIPFGFLGFKKEKFFITYLVPILSFYVWSFIGAYFSYQTSVLTYSFIFKLFYVFIVGFYSISILAKTTKNQIKSLGEENMSDKYLMQKVHLRARGGSFSYSLMSSGVQMKLLQGQKFLTISFLILYFFPDYANKIYFYLPQLFAELFIK